jgi:hypothetical protein
MGKRSRMQTDSDSDDELANLFSKKTNFSRELRKNPTRSSVRKQQEDIKLKKELEEEEKRIKKLEAQEKKLKTALKREEKAQKVREDDELVDMLTKFSFRIKTSRRKHSGKRKLSKRKSHRSKRRSIKGTKVPSGSKNPRKRSKGKRKH